MAAFSFNAWGISFTIITDNAEVVRDVARELSSAAITLGAIYGLKSLIDRAITITFGGNDRDDQNGPDIRPGSLHVSIRCLTEARFLEVLEDYESGKIKQSLQEELLKVGIKTKGLKIKIDNMEEVEKTKTAIKNR